MRFLLTPTRLQSSLCRVDMFHLKKEEEPVDIVHWLSHHTVNRYAKGERVRRRYKTWSHALESSVSKKLRE